MAARCPLTRAPFEYLAHSTEGGMRIVFALIVMTLFAAPAFAGSHNNNGSQKKIDNLNNKIAQTVLTPSDDRREKIDNLEARLAYTLFKSHDK